VTPARERGPSTSPNDRDIVRDPAIVGDAGRLGGALGDRSLPELNAAEIVVAVGLASVVSEKRVAFAGGGDRRERTKPGRDVALDLRLNGVLEPEIGAVGVLGSSRHHGRVGPARRPFVRNGGGDRALIGLQEIYLKRPRARSDHAFVLEVV